MTEVFKCRHEAESFAKKTGSYVYPVNFYEKSFDKGFNEVGRRIVKPYGHAVPK